MNAQSLWAGNDYAWIPDRPKGVTFSVNARRIRLRKVTKHRVRGNANASTFVEFEVLDWEGNANPDPDVRSGVLAREIQDFWDAYWADHQDVLQRHLDAQKAAAEAARVRQAENKMILDELEKRGLRRDATHIDSNYGSVVRINRKDLIEWLEVHVPPVEVTTTTTRSPLEIGKERPAWS